MKHKWVRDEDVSICKNCGFVLDKRDDEKIPPCKKALAQFSAKAGGGE